MLKTVTMRVLQGNRTKNWWPEPPVPGSSAEPDEAGTGRQTLLGNPVPECQAVAQTAGG